MPAQISRQTAVSPQASLSAPARSTPVHAMMGLIRKLAPRAEMQVVTRADTTPESINHILIILTPDPVQRIAAWLDAGRSPEQALAAWDDEARWTLTLHRQNRSRVILVNPHIATDDNTPGSDLFLRRITALTDQGEAQFALCAGTAEEDSPAPPASHVAIALAHAILQSDDTAELSAELEAVTYGAVQGRNMLDIAGQAWQEQAAGTVSAEMAQELEDLTARLAQSEQEQTALRKRGDLLAENLELQMTRLDQAAQDRQSATAEYQAISAKLDQANMALSQQVAEADRERKSLIASRKAIETRRAYAQRRIDQLLASRSWRVTRPLRAIGRLFS